MRTGLLLIAAILVLTLTGCLKPESPCHFFQLYQREMYNNVWNIDSLHVHVYNDTSQFARDTTYTNYGTLKFVPNTPYSCQDYGQMNITTTNNNLVQMQYYTGANETDVVTNTYAYNQMCVTSDTSLDGYPAAYNLCSYDSFLPGHIKIYGDTQSVHDPVIRYWEFFLSTK
jgi:hypothetical protein